MNEISNIFNLFSLFLILIFSIFLLTSKGTTKRSNGFLAGFLLINSIPLIFFIARYYKLTAISYNPDLIVILYFFDFLMGPFFFFYIKTLLFPDSKFDRKVLFHGTLPLLYIVYLAIRFSFIIPLHQNWYLNSLRIELTLITVFSHIVLIIYALISFSAIRKFIYCYKNKYSSLDRLKINWLKFLILSYGLIWSMVILNTFLYKFTQRGIPGSEFLFSCLSLITILTILFFGLKKPLFFSKINSIPKSPDLQITGDQKKRYLKKITDHMRRDKPYLTPALTVDDLSSALGIPPRYVSRTINSELNCNFFDFVNSYRVKEAQNYLLKKSKELTNLQILFEVGFNSKATFNRAFAKHTGMNPTQFKKQHLGH